MTKIVKYKLFPDSDAHYDYLDGDGEIVDDAPVLSLEELADFLDAKAEARNHPYVGVHRKLAAVLIDAVGRVNAETLMQHLAHHGGLDNLDERLTTPPLWMAWSLRHLEAPDSQQRKGL